MANKLLFFLLPLIIAACANPQAPSGGPPDKSPPLITSYEPSDRTLNFSDKSIKIKFNKYMDHNSVIESIFLSPSKKLDFDWSGKTLKISFDEPLDPNTTYSLTLGTEYFDIRQNKPTQAFNLIFSTGSKIDTGTIKGKLFDASPAGAFIFAYSLEGINPDTLDPRHTKPTYRTQVGANGTFSLNALKNGRYRIAAVRDLYKDEIFDEGTDAFSAAQKDYQVSDSSVPDISLKIGKSSDNAGPMIYEAEALSDRKISASFSEEIDTASISAASFEIFDSSGSKKATVLHAYLDSKSASKINIITESPLDTALSWKLRINNDRAYALRDSSGNIIVDTARTAKFFPLSEKDTSSFYLTAPPFADSAKSFNPMNEIRFIFSIPFEDEFFKKRIKFIRYPDSSNVPFQIRWKQDNMLILEPAEILQSETWYEISFKMDSLKVFSQMPVKDTTIRLRFRTDDIRTYSGISGVIRDTSKYDGAYVVNLFSMEKKISKMTIADEKRKWKFENVQPGNYSVEIFYDSNRNGRYDYGTAFPFTFSEKFFSYQGEIQLKPRWKVEDFILEIK